MKKIFIAVIMALIIVFGFAYFNKNQTEKEAAGPVDMGTKSGPLNAEYLIDGEVFVLVDGFTEKEIGTNSATKNKLSVFGKPSFGDIDEDGDDDAVLILVNDPGGSGTFYYATVVINNNGEYKGVDSILLGDRITPRDFYIKDGKAVVNYTVRNLEEDFSVSPSLEKTLHMKVDAETSRLIEIAVDFEGEADPKVMKIDMKTWTWVKTVDADNKEILPKKSDAFTLAFDKEGLVSATTDCNSISGSYKVDKNDITFGQTVMTQLFCQDSQEQDFAKMLAEAESFSFTPKGELVFKLKSEGAMATFR